MCPVEWAVTKAQSGTVTNHVNKEKACEPGRGGHWPHPPHPAHGPQFSSSIGVGNQHARLDDELPRVPVRLHAGRV